MKGLIIKPGAKPNTKVAAYYQSELERVLTREELSDNTRKGIEELREFYSTNIDSPLFSREAKLLLDKAHAEIEKRLAEDLTD